MRNLNKSTIPQFTLEGNKADFSQAVSTIGTVYALLDSLTLTNFDELPSETANISIEGLKFLLKPAFNTLLEMNVEVSNDNA